MLPVLLLSRKSNQKFESVRTKNLKLTAWFALLIGFANICDPSISVKTAEQVVMFTEIITISVKTAEQVIVFTEIKSISVVLTEI
jgi:hypothetical protein